LHRRDDHYSMREVRARLEQLDFQLILRADMSEQAAFG
jgi:hypothetical protein